MEIVACFSVSVELVSITTVWSAPRRDPLGRPASLGGHRSSCLSVVWFLWLKLLHVCFLQHEFLLSLSHATAPSRVLMTFSLSGMHAGCSSHAFDCCELVFLLDEASTECGYPSFLTWLCTSLSAGTPRLRHVWWSLLALSRFTHVLHRFLGCFS